MKACGNRAEDDGCCGTCYDEGYQDGKHALDNLMDTIRSLLHIALETFSAAHDENHTPRQTRAKMDEARAIITNEVIPLLGEHEPDQQEVDLLDNLRFAMKAFGFRPDVAAVKIMRLEERLEGCIQSNNELQSQTVQQAERLCEMHGTLKSLVGGEDDGFEPVPYGQMDLLVDGEDVNKALEILRRQNESSK